MQRSLTRYHRRSQTTARECGTLRGADGREGCGSPGDDGKRTMLEPGNLPAEILQLDLHGRSKILGELHYTILRMYVERGEVPPGRSGNAY